jgi:hypothetical protein
MLQLIGPQVTVAFSVLIFAGAVVVAWQLPRHVVVAPERTRPVEAAELRSGGILLAASAMAILRAVVGFLTFELAFWLRHTGAPTLWFGVILVFSAVGTLAGNAIGPVVRQQLKEERMLIAALGLTAAAGIVGAVTAGKGSAALLTGVVGFSAAVARLAFDSIVQRDAPDANRGRAFARFETRFQLGWVLAAFVPVLITIPAAVGFALIGIVALSAMLSYLFGARHLRQKGVLPEKLSRRAWREVQRRRAERQVAHKQANAVGSPLPPPTPPNR